MDPEETQGASLDPEETLRAPPDPVEQTQKASSDLEMETKDEAEPVAGAAKLGGPVVPALRKLTISGIFRQILSSQTWSRRLVRASMEGAAPQFFLSTIKEGDEESVSVCYGGGSMVLRAKVEIPEPVARGISLEQ